MEKETRKKEENILWAEIVQLLLNYEEKPWCFSEKLKISANQFEFPGGCYLHFHFKWGDVRL